MQHFGTACAFAATVTLAWAFDWNASDLVWGLWLSSFTVGTLIMLSQCLRMPIGVLKGSLAQRGEFTVSQIVLGLAAVLAFNGVVLAFFSLHFGFFHFCHGFLLSGVLDPDGLDYPRSFWQLPGFVLRLLPKYYGVVLASAFAERELILRPEGLQRVEEPYKGVIKIHVLVMVLLVLHALGATHIVFYAVALLAYFTPWNAFTGKESENRLAATSERGLERI